MGLLNELLYWLRGQGLRPQPNPAIGPVVSSIAGGHLQRRAWRNFVFIGQRGIEIVRNRGNDPRRRERIVLPYSSFAKVECVHYDSGTPTDLTFLDANGIELARAVDVDPRTVGAVITHVRSHLGRSS